jgi:uroporphyrinogen-III synthase
LNNVLQGARVLVTRPIHQSENLTRLIEQAGGEAVCFPTLVIAGLNNVDEIRKTLQSLERYQWLIFISANAVNFALRANGGKIPKSKSVVFAAVGLATAQALADAGLTVDIVPQQDFNSEALLAMPQLQRIAGQAVLIVRGQGGREELANMLRERGATVDYLPVYKREIPQGNNMLLTDLVSQNGLDVITITSGEALQNLVIMLGEQQLAPLVQVPLVVVSDRIKCLATSIGFNRIAVTKSPSDSAILETVMTFVTGNKRG